MYEPIYVPLIEHTLLSLDTVRFGISHFKGPRNVGDPLLDPVHIHDCIELFFCVQGGVSFLVNGQIYPVAKGDVVISCPNEIHMCLFEKSAEYEYYCLWIDPNAPTELLAFMEKSSSSPVLTFPQNISERIVDLLARLADLPNELERTASLLQLFLLLQKKSLSQSEISYIPSELREIIEDINLNFSSLHSISELCAAHFISTASLNRWFRSYLHITPHEYIESKRLSYAAELLSRGFGVSDACEAAGFSDCSHFIKLFKRKFGQTPLQFKRNGR